MNPSNAQRELLLRHLDGRLKLEERLRVAESLRTDPAARVFLREVAEQAVMVADLERIAAGRQAALHPRPIRLADQGRTIVPVNSRAWPWGPARKSHTRSVEKISGLAPAAIVTLLAVAAFQFLPASKPGIVRVSKVTGFRWQRGRGIERTPGGRIAEPEGVTLRDASTQADQLLGF